METGPSIPLAKSVSAAPSKTRVIVITAVATLVLLLGTYWGLAFAEQRALSQLAADDLRAALAATDSALNWQERHRADGDSLIRALLSETDPLASASIYYHARRWSMRSPEFEVRTEALEALVASRAWPLGDLPRRSRNALRAARDAQREWDAFTSSGGERARVVGSLPLEPAVFAATIVDAPQSVGDVVQRPLATQLLAVDPAQVKAVMLAVDMTGIQREGLRLKLVAFQREATALLDHLRPPSAAPPVAEVQAVAVPAAVVPERIDSVATNFSRWIAGRDSRDRTPAYQKHVQQVRETLEQLQRTKLAPIADFGMQQLREAQEARFLLYPFAGGDVLYADAFFPAADTILMFGLEPVGTLFVPGEETEAKRVAYLTSLRAATSTSNRLGFFVTNRMKDDFRGDLLNGVIHPMLYYLAWQGFDVVRIEPIGGDSLAPPSARIPGVRLVVRKPGRSAERVIEYLRVDVSDGAVERDDAILQRIASRPGAHVYLKAGSYLLHMPKFTRIRDAMLQKAAGVLQDDSGFRFASLDERFEQIRVFGTYERTIDLFTWAIQPALQRKYAETPNVAPIPFRIGYAAQIGSSNLQYATKPRP